ncbi:MAG: hypothetical protein QW757_01055 [Candidatus Woesearchaeota archaeon]
MKKKIIIKIIFLLLISLLSIYQTKAQCELNEIPFIEINENQLFNYNVSFKFQNISQNITEIISDIKLSIININSTINPELKKIDLGNYQISFKPNNTNSGKNSFLIVSTMKNGCYDIKKMEFFVYLKPIILEQKPKENYIEIYETENIKFFVNASSFYDELKTEWHVNKKKVKENSNNFIFFTNYTNNGLYDIEFIAKDKRQNSTIKWQINVKDKNRNPILKNNIPDFVLTNYTRGFLFNLNDYFQDPDLDKLNFTLLHVEENGNLINESSKLFDIYIKENADLEIYPKAEIYLKEFYQIKAQDYLGLLAYSNLFYFKLASSENITQLFINSTKKEQCKVQIECSEWSLCMPTNIRTRECYDINNCNGENKKITETEKCDYNATCFDGIKNQNEENIDCGGPCEPCPTCFDGIKNQNEENIDCGGPCEPCPTCFDNKQNQDETDVDCGGSCKPCESEKKCLKHKDCESFNCINNICAYPTCFDNKQNQNEEKVDCGGPCLPCPSCNDGILNQNEEKIDCGGPCEPCPTCFDNKQNQDETDIDCGGSCNPCESEKKCLIHKDCISFNCINNICAYPSCFDNKLNQNEEKVDCGGPCNPCPSCNDGILNQNEEKVDCGGPCKSCESCFDGIKNQDEIFVDCGNSCKSCFLLDSLNFLKRNYYFFIIIIIIFLVYMYLLNLYNKDKITNLSKYSKFLGFMHAKIENKEIFEKTITNLENLKKELINLNEKEEIKKNFLIIINKFFQELLTIEEKFTEQELKRELTKKILNPFLRQLLIEFYFDSKNITTESPFFRIEMNQKIEQSINILNKIRELI